MEVEIIKEAICRLDTTLRVNTGKGFSYATEDRLLDAIYKILIEDKELAVLEDVSECRKM